MNHWPGARQPNKMKQKDGEHLRWLVKCATPLESHAIFSCSATNTFQPKWELIQMEAHDSRHNGIQLLSSTLFRQYLA